ncbi:MAG: hypothetical protein AB8F74_19300 [Saprospiraceae bacterium]
MKFKMFKKLVPVIALLALLATLSSCNRGLGCPNNFSIGDTVSAVVDAAVPSVFTKE